MKGLYRSKYVNQQGEEAYAFVTQFEATDARRYLCTTTTLQFVSK